MEATARFKWLLNNIKYHLILTGDTEQHGIH